MSVSYELDLMTTTGELVTIRPGSSAPPESTRPMSGQAIAALMSIFAVIQVAWIVALAYGVIRILT
jgi:hypothetical protein